MFEHILVDAGSTDGTAGLISNYAASHPHVRLLFQADASVAEVGNMALKKARHELISWLGVHERYNPEAFCVVAKNFEENKDLSFLIGSHNEVHDHGSIVEGESSSYTNRTDLIEFWKSWGSSIILPWHSTFYRRNVHDVLGPFDEQFRNHEYEFFIRAAELYKFSCIAERLTNYPNGSESQTNLINLSRASQNDFLKASRTYWGESTNKTVWRRAASSWLYMKFRRQALIIDQIASFPGRKISSAIKACKMKVIDKHNRRFFSQILETPPMEVNPYSSVEIHSLCCKRDLYMLILCLKSFLRYYTDVRVVIHDDGTLSKKGRKQLRDHIRGVEISSIRSDPNEFDELADRDFNIYKAKGIANYSKGDKIIMIDSDMLFINEPSEILDWIRSYQKIQLYGPDRWDNHNPYIEIKRTFNKTNLPPYFNAGLMCLYAENFDRNEFISEFKHLKEFNKIVYVEQAAFCLMVSRNTYKELPRSRYVPCFFSNPDYGKLEITRDTTQLHFMGVKTNKVNELYRRHAEQVLVELDLFNILSKDNLPKDGYNNLLRTKRSRDLAKKKETVHH